MTEVERLKEKVDLLKESIRMDWLDIGVEALTNEQRGDIRMHILLCIDDMKELVQQLDEKNA